MRQSSQHYGAIPLYETAVAYTLRAQMPQVGFGQRAINVVGPRAGGVLYEWWRAAAGEAASEVSSDGVGRVANDMAGRVANDSVRGVASGGVASDSRSQAPSTSTPAHPIGHRHPATAPPISRDTVVTQS